VGKEILYCNKCGKQLLGDDFTRGRAHTFENRQFCTQCLPASHTPKPMPVPSSTSRIPKRQASSMPLPVQGVEPSGASISALLISLGVGVGVLILLLVLFLNPSRPTEPLPPPPLAVAPRPPADVKKPVDDPARKTVEQARQFSSGNPHAVDERVRLWEQAVAATAKTPYADEALKGLEQSIAQRKEEFAQEIQALEPKLAERMKAEQFGVASDLLEEAKKRHETSPGWTAAVSRKIRDVQEAAEKLYPDLKGKALAAQAAGDNARVTQAKARVSGWGRRDLLADLETELGKVVPRETIPPGATLLFRFPHEGPKQPYRIYGPVRDGGLVSPPYQSHAVLGGFEAIREPIAIPSEGEIWVTYSTTSSKPLMIRFRMIRGDKTFPYNWYLNNPEVGRPVRVKVPMTQFKDYGGKPIVVGECFGTIYFQQDDPKAQLVVYDTVIFRTKE
jgi:hypothetical protein